MTADEAVDASDEDPGARGIVGEGGMVDGEFLALCECLIFSLCESLQKDSLAS